VLTFRDNKDDGMELMGTQFTDTGLLEELMEGYLKRHDSIPAFLAAVALKIFDDLQGAATQP